MLNNCINSNLFSEKPFFLAEPRDITVSSGRDAEFDCQVGGDPPPKILWRRENQKMPSGRSQILESNSLRITSVTPADEGTYTCDAENEIGSISAKATLIVHGTVNFTYYLSDSDLSKCLMEGLIETFGFKYVM